ncbi:MAG: 16S rRNA (cytidine(1402)-2'-O)-methyltransferase, partial [Galactobacillus timonensis]|nr:16S rRNA (cytidine(1402)-2'-O)-methyltransferase [Galactobacillus timonensis]
PHRIEKMLRDALVVFGDRKCCVARELTKVHEEFLRGTISEVLEVIPDRKGEMVVVIAGAEQLQPELDEGVLIAMVNEETAKGLSKNAAVKAVASRTGVARNLLYDLVHEKRN